MSVRLLRAMTPQAKITVEIAYALPQRQAIIALKVASGTTAQSAVIASGILGQFPEIDLTTNRMGIFGKLAKPDTVLENMDRVEIYRPLIADPKAIRKRRADENRKMSKKRQ